MTDENRILDVLRDAGDCQDNPVGFVYSSAPAFLKATDAKGNANYSPVSLWIALAIAAQGADGRTLEQLKDVLGLDGLNGDNYRSLIGSINRCRPHAKSMTATHDSVWIDHGTETLPSFVGTARNVFDAQVETVDFADPATGRRIGEWIAKHTGGMIRPGIELTGREALAIVNTVFADGRWATPFEVEDTKPDTFHGEQGDRDVPFMHDCWNDTSYLCDETYGWERLDLPFDDGGQLRVILPDPGRLDAIISDPVALRRAIGTEWESAMPTKNKKTLVGMDRVKAKLAARKHPEHMPLYANNVMANISLPRFEIDSTFDSEEIITVLRAMGVTDAFNPNIADFSRMSTDPLCISSITQGTRIQVNEHGAKAAAYTMMCVEVGAVPQFGDLITFNVNRPFLYALVTHDQLPLFIGTVRNL